jgi:hypothetical protein
MNCVTVRAVIMLAPATKAENIIRIIHYLRGLTGMPSVTIIVSAGSGWSTMLSFGWKEKRNNLGG